MAITPAALAATQLTNAAVAIYQTPVGGHTVIKRAVFSNVTASPVTITVNRVPNGGSVLSSNQIITTLSVNADSSYIANELGNMVLNGGDAIYALASANTSINAFMSGFTY